MFLFTEIASGAVLNKTDPNVLSKTNHITIPFVENKGQLKDPDTVFYSNTFAGRVSVNRDGSIGYHLVGNQAGQEKQLIEIREKFSGALKTSPSGGDKAIAKVSHFQGKDPDKWVTDIPTFNSVHMGEIYQGVSLKLQAHANNVEKIFFVHPGSDPKKIQLNIDGAKALRLTPKGELEVNTSGGTMRFSKPVAYQRIHGRKTPVDVAYTVKDGSYGFKLAAYDKSKELIIDPLITGIFQGTADTLTRPTCLAADSQGNIYAAGYSANQFAVFKFDRRLEKLQNSALFGSASSNDQKYRILHDIAVDRHDAVYLVGGTEDEAFPVTQGAFDTRLTEGPYNIEPDGFIIKYNADLNEILSSTFVGEDGFDIAYGIAIARDDTVVVTGQTGGATRDGTPFPTTPNAYDTNSAIWGKTKVFVMRLDADLRTMLASSLLGYSGDENNGGNHPDDFAYDVAIDAEGAIIVTGKTESEQFPVTANCADAAFQGESEAFVSKFDPDLTQLLASTFLGGANKEKANVLAITANNEIVVAGWTLSSDFPVVQGNYDTSFNSDEDGFVTRLNSDLTAIRASTFLGGNEIEQVSDMVIGDDGTIYLCGGTGSSDFPVTDDFYDNSFNNNSGYATDFYEGGDGFITVLDQTLTTLNTSTYLGGTSTDHITSILLNRYTTEDGIKEDIIVAGETWSTDFPYITVKTGKSDAFLCRFNPNENPEAPPVKGRPGHWSSKESYISLTPSIFLDANICDDGSFSGISKVYACTLTTIWSITTNSCTLPSNGTSRPVSGTIDFEKGEGKITLEDGIKDLPFIIFNQLPDEFTIEINPDGTADFPTTRSTFHYIGTGTCNNSGVTPDSDESGSGSGGGGCFLNSVGSSLGRWCKIP
jgi:hypothetical protein